MKKKLICIILALTLFACVIPFGAVLADGNPSHDHFGGHTLMSDGRSYWYACDNEDRQCDLQSVADYEVAFASNKGEELKDDLTYVSEEEIKASTMRMGRQGLITGEGADGVSKTVGRTIIPLSQSQLEAISSTLIIIGCDDSDSNKQVDITVDCAYTCFWDGGNLIDAASMGVAAFVIFDEDDLGGDITGYGCYKIYHDWADTVNDSTLIGVALYEAPRTFKAVYDTTNDANTLNFYFDNVDHSGDNKTVYEGESGDNYLYSTGDGWGYFDIAEDIKSVTIDSTVIKYKGLTTTSAMFADFLNAESITGAEYLDVTNVEDMSAMFYCFGQSTTNTIISAPAIDGWNTAKLQKLSNMFLNYGNSTDGAYFNLDLSGWDLRYVNNSGNAFTVSVVNEWNVTIPAYTDELENKPNAWYGYSKWDIVAPPTGASFTVAE